MTHGHHPPARRIALISKHFPPSEEAGALRWQKLSALAAEHGYALTVATRSFGELTRRDDRRLAELPATLRILEIPTPQTAFDAFEDAVMGLRRRIPRGTSSPAAAARVSPGVLATATPVASVSRREARGPLSSVADLRRAYHATALRASELSWARAAADALADGDVPELLITCGPPHQCHLAGASLARRWRVPHVLDMRDPWSLVERVPAPFGSRRLWQAAAADERAAFAEAALIVVNTEAHAEALRDLHPRHRDRIVAVLNGFDDDAVPAPSPQPAFTIVYAGTVYLDRDPAMLLVPVAELVTRAQLAPADLQLVFVGDVETGGGPGLAEVAESLGLGAFVQARGRVSRAKAMELLATADLNVVLPQDSHLAVPSKVYEYLRFNAWLLALAEPLSATARTLAGTGADVVHPGNRAGIADAIWRRMQERRSGGRPDPLARSSSHLSRRAQAEVLFARLAQLGR